MKKYTQEEVESLLEKQRLLCAEKVREPYLKNGMSNLASRAYHSCLNADLLFVEPEKDNQFSINNRAKMIDRILKRKIE